MRNLAERPNSIPWPPLIYIGSAAAGVLLHWLVPLPWPAGTLQLALAAAGLCLMCAGLALEIVTALAFRRRNTTILPHRGATTLITDGPFAKSRNPIYVGNTFLVTGIGLLLGIVWLLPAALVAAVATQKLAIEPEEKHLSLRFGDAWSDYASRTPRWLLF